MLIIILFVYNIGLGRRTPILMIPITILFAFFLDLFVIGRKNKFPKKKLIAMGIIVVIIGVFAVIYVTNYRLIVRLFGDTMFAKRFAWLKFDAERLELILEAIKLAPAHIWGGQEISTAMDQMIHNLWFDVFDYAGIIPAIIVLVYSIYCVVLIIKISINKHISNGFKMLVLPLSLCIFMEMCLEPAMSGLSLILLCIVIINTLLEKLLYECK